MGWIPQALASALHQAAELNVKIDYNDHSFIIIMNDYGDLRLNVLFTSRQIIIETIICPLSSPIHTISAIFQNDVLLSRQKRAATSTPPRIAP